MDKIDSSKKILLVNLPYALGNSYSKGGNAYPSTAIMLIGSVLSASGYKVSIVDGAVDENYFMEVQRICLENDDLLFVGMSVMTTQIPFAVQISELVKSLRKSLKIVWGGPHPTLFPEQTLSNDNVDIIAINEGSETAVNLSDALRNYLNLKSVHGIGFKDNEKKIIINGVASCDRIDVLPHLDFNLIKVKQYLEPRGESVYKREFPNVKTDLRIMPILTGLGCPYRCEFCINVILKRQYRFRSAESIVNEIKRLMGAYNANTFLFLDEDFFISKKRFLEFLDIVEKENLHFNWRTWCRVDHFKPDYLNEHQLERIDRIGSVSLAMGAESANQDVLDSIGKGIKVEHIERSLESLKKTRIFPRYSFMVGLENEGMEQIRNTYRFCVKMKKKEPRVDIAGPFVFRLYPGSRIYHRLTEKFELSIPKTLKDWVEYLRNESVYTPMPWVPEKFKKFSDKVQLYSDFALSYSQNSRNIVLRLIKKILMCVARMRINYFFFRCPIEIKLVNAFKSVRAK